jgi:hypothetical protein
MKEWVRNTRADNGVEAAAVARAVSGRLLALALELVPVRGGAARAVTNCSNVPAISGPAGLTAVGAEAILILQTRGET